MKVSNEWPKWWGVDLDNTLARSEEPFNLFTIGDPVPSMIKMVRYILDRNHTVKIFTARLADKEHTEEIKQLIRDWTLKYVGTALEATCEKDPGLVKFFDDRAITVTPDKGKKPTPPQINITIMSPEMSSKNNAAMGIPIAVEDIDNIDLTRSKQIAQRLDKKRQRSDEMSSRKTAETDKNPPGTEDRKFEPFTNGWALYDGQRVDEIQNNSIDSMLHPMGKEAAPKVVWYHGTDVKNLESIKHEGLAPGKKLNWDVDSNSNITSPSLTSVGGTYFSNNLRRAVNAPRIKTDRVLIVCAELQPNTMYMDEDDIREMVKYPISSEEYPINSKDNDPIKLMQLYTKLKNNKKQNDIIKYKEEYENRVIKSLTTLFKNKKLEFHEKLKDRVKSLLGNVWEAALTRQVAHAYKTTPIEGNTFPSIQKGEQLFRDSLNELTKTLRILIRTNEGANINTDTARVTGPITYSGANRIVCLVEMRDEWIGSKGSLLMIVHYGKIPINLWEQVNEKFGGRNIISAQYSDGTPISNPISKEASLMPKESTNPLHTLKSYLTMSRREEAEAMAEAFPEQWYEFSEEDPYTADDQTLETFFHNYYSYCRHSDPLSCPAIMFFTYKGGPRVNWCVHFTNNALQIANEGFTTGVDDPNKLALTQYNEDKGTGGYCFGVPLKWVGGPETKKYGFQAVLCYTQFITVYHETDPMPWQAIFWGPTCKVRIPCIQNEEGKWVRLDKEGNPKKVADTILGLLPRRR